MREELFITTKLAIEAKTYEEAAAAINGSLEKLGLDYIDLMLIHSPPPWADFRGSDYSQGNREAWRALEDAYKAGKLRAIGVSDFNEADLENILASCSVAPMVNQLLVHIGNTPNALMADCRSKDILVEAYSPVAHGEILKHSEVAAIAEKYGVSIPQLCIKYDFPEGSAAGDVFYNISFGQSPYYKHQGWLSGRVTTDDNFTFGKKGELTEWQRKKI